MNRKVLHQLYTEHTGKVSDKWSLYLAEYDRLLQDYRDKAVRLLEIGVQNGGSLEIWSKYFRNASALIGCDINTDCARLTFDDPRIGVIVGDANSHDAFEQVLRRCSQFDIIIDDGSHLSSDIVRSFALYFPRLAEGGVFIAEDLHCSYWKQFEGGLFDPYSSISFFKRLADVVNHEHWGIPGSRVDLLRSILLRYGCEFDAEILFHVHSVEFINSMCAVRKAPTSSNSLGTRVIAGSLELVVSGHQQLHGIPHELDPIFEQSGDPCAEIATPPDEALHLAKVALANTQHELAAVEQKNVALSDEISSLRNTIDALRNSMSWRITAPLRYAGAGARRLVRRLARGSSEPPPGTRAAMPRGTQADGKAHE